MDLKPEQQRVLGALIEKSMTTPDHYPLTLNSLTAACNQSSSRSPVVDYAEAAVADTVDELRAESLVRAVHRPGQRSVRYKHALDEALVIDGEQLALLAVLMLRGPQTSGELRTRSTRYHEFTVLDEVEAVLNGLATRDQPLARRLDRRPGEKEPRWVHLLGNGQEVGEYAAQGPEQAIREPESAPAPQEASPDLDRAIADLVARVTRLEEALGLEAD